ncbi:MAG: serine/threonine-protein kinase, partial [Gemmatimonas sp.]
MTIAEQLRSELSGRYEIEAEIGQGGMATVYLARDIRHSRRVAVKVLNPDLGAVLGVERFLSEIETTANLQHPNLLPLFDSGAAGSLFYYVMPFVDGESLRSRLDREKQLPVDEAVRMTVAVAKALDYAHRHGVIHRDLKPENILLQDGQPLVADFGIALAVSNAGGNRITQTGLSLGTPSYMSPEQATGDRNIDARTDVYSLAAVAYEMLVGEPPHVGSTSQAIIARLLTEKPRSIRTTRPNVPLHVEAAIERGLEKLPADRWATAKEFAEALLNPAAFSTSMHAATRNTSQQTQARRRLSIREAVLAGIAVAALAASTMLGIRLMRPADMPPMVSFKLDLPGDLEAVTGNSAGAVAISLDGSVIVFQGAYKSKRGVSLFARRLNDQRVQLIPGTEGGTRPTLSPDGADLLYTDESVLKRVSMSGGDAQTIVESSNFATWSDDGRILYAKPGNGEIWMVGETGGAPTLLARPDTTRRHFSYGMPFVLPGGQSALITVRTNRNSLDSTFLAVLAIPSGKVTELGVRGTWPRYTSSGHILYATTDNWLMSVAY